MRRFEYAFFGRYEYQSWEIEVRFDPQGAALADADLDMLVEAFHRMHDRIYSIRSDDDIVEFTTWKVRAIGARGGSDLWRGHVLPSGTAQARPKGNRSIYLRDDGGMRSVPVYDAHTLPSGATVAGPCLIDANTFTALLVRDHVGTMDQHGNLLVEVQ
jgi:N-methylhydantoinase A